MTPYAVFALAWLVPIWIGVVVVVAVRRQRGRVMTAGWWAAGVVSLVATMIAAALVAGRVVPDAVDALPPADRSVVGAVLDSTLCGTVPFGRVVDVELDRDPETARPRRLHFTCALTPLGVLRWDDDAFCADGTWMTSGVWGPGSAGECRP